MAETIKVEDTDVNIIISEDVVVGIALNAVREVEGVDGLSSKLSASDIKELFSKRSVNKGVKVEMSENTVAISVLINVKNGVIIPEVAEKVQVAIKNAVETMTGLLVTKVNVNVVGITFPREISSK